MQKWIIVQDLELIQKLFGAILNSCQNYRKFTWNLLKICKHHPSVILIFYLIMIIFQLFAIIFPKYQIEIILILLIFRLLNNVFVQCLRKLEASSHLDPPPNSLPQSTGPQAFLPWPQRPPLPAELRQLFPFLVSKQTSKIYFYTAWLMNIMTRKDWFKSMKKIRK